jgi:hypothetical protein
LNISDGDGEKIRTCEAKSKVETHRRAGKLGDVKCFTRKTTTDTEARRETWEKDRFFRTNPLVINIVLCKGPIKHPPS